MGINLFCWWLCRCVIPYAQPHLKLCCFSRAETVLEHRSHSCCVCFVFLFFEQTLGFKKGNHPKFNRSFTTLSKMCWGASPRVKTPLWNMLSCLLYYSLYFFFVFLCICVITSSVISVYFFVMYTSNVECRTVFDARDVSPYSLLCVSVLFTCDQLCTIILPHRKQAHWVSPLNLLLLSVKNAGLHVYNMDILYTAKHAGPYQTPPLERLVLHPSTPPDATVFSRLLSFFLSSPLSLHHLLKHRRTVRLCPLAVFLRV